MNSIKEFIKNIETGIEGTKSNGKINTSTVNLIETELGVKLPEVYKHFLHEFGSGKIGFIDFLGAKPNLDIYLKTPVNIIYVNKDLREGGLNNNLIVISDSGDQEYFVLDCSKNSTTYGSIYVWNPSLSDEPIGELEYISNDLLEFLRKALNEQL
ncbi:hypothetical protein A8C32_09520 [Flavivirga aquatica]|uniref:Knr4/Smi1-like domain-containing protein n=1 Tax=Flavivirga aquatica TaxID=1849968 RepID=A0A1E5SJT4_9FLAO|nr:SMI1/KNR4 family protein [Flavivirga aquatica]OEJ99389.1 hypothetical protein A8C32_09520 [Flavivirga aquatica]